MAMEFKRSEQVALIEALAALSRGEPGPFQDALWLGFGDEWIPVLHALRDHRLITLPADDPCRASLTHQGERYLDRLRSEPDRPGPDTSRSEPRSRARDAGDGSSSAPGPLRGSHPSSMRETG